MSREQEAANHLGVAVESLRSAQRILAGPRQQDNAEIVTALHRLTEAVRAIRTPLDPRLLASREAAEKEMAKG